MQQQQQLAVAVGELDLRILQCNSCGLPLVVEHGRRLQRQPKHAPKRSSRKLLPSGPSQDGTELLKRDVVVVIFFYNY